jgi:hypothetical protein
MLFGVGTQTTIFVEITVEIPCKPMNKGVLLNYKKTFSFSLKTFVWFEWMFEGPKFLYTTRSVNIVKFSHIILLLVLFLQLSVNTGRTDR